MKIIFTARHPHGAEICQAVSPSRLLHSDGAVSKRLLPSNGVVEAEGWMMKRVSLESAWIRNVSLLTGKKLQQDK